MKEKLDTCIHINAKKKINVMIWTNAVNFRLHSHESFRVVRP